MKKIKVIKKNKKQKYRENQLEHGNAITFVQQRKILKSIDNKKYLDFFYFCCCTGVRPCEALSIKVKDIDTKTRIINIKLPDSKTKKHKRKIPYLQELFDNIELKGKYLFNEITDEGSKQYFCKLYKTLNYDLTRHSTRHTFISVCNHIGIDVEQVQLWAGHTDTKMTTETYTHELEKGSSPILNYFKKLKKEYYKK